MEKIIVDGNGVVLGRLGTFVCKSLLKGNSVDIINSEKVIISGNGKVVAEKISAKRNMGRGSSMKGPKYIRQEDRLLKRMLRGMLPRDKLRGREAFKRLKCYIGEGKDNENAIKVQCKKPIKFSTMKEIVGMLK